AVLLREGHGGPAARYLAGYLELREDEPARAEEISEFARMRLPSFLVPASLQVLPALPLLPNGKVDRRALALLDAPLTAGAAPDRPLTETEEALAGIWRELLGVEQVGPHDDFFR